MKKVCLSLLSIIIALSVVSCGKDDKVKREHVIRDYVGVEEDMALMNDYVGKFVKSPEDIPVSYIYDGKEYRGLPANAVASEKEEGYIKYTTFTASVEDDIEIVANCREYLKYPVVEWELYFTNKGSADSKIFEKILPIDTTFNGDKPQVVANTGDFASSSGYFDSVSDIAKGDEFYYTPSNGRSCNEQFPYQKLMFDDFGMNIAIGWSGKWFTEYKSDVKGVVDFKAGQERCKTYIKPEETYRAPTITLMTYKGDEDVGVNVWRRWYYDHILFKDEDGAPIEGMVAMTNSYASEPSDEYTKASEENQLASLNKLKEIDVMPDVWWIDAGWYNHKVNEELYKESGWYKARLKEAGGVDDGNIIDQKRWWNVGTWEADAERFPNGIKPVGEKCEEIGTKLLLWFEPERVIAGSKIYEEHPEWLLTSPDEEWDESSLLDLGNKECLSWLSEYIANFISESKVKWYREDFNFDPLPFWTKYEDEDREGMVENQFIQGLYKYWDYIVEKNPGLLIDSCASGGRRNDLETMRRAVPLHHTDFGYGYTPVKQAFSYQLSRWIPYYKSFPGVWEMDQSFRDDYGTVPVEENFTSYVYLNSLAPMHAATMPMQAATTPELFADNPEHLKYYKEVFKPIWEKASPMMLKGDFYSLSGKVFKSYNEWVVFQFNMPEDNEGMIKSMKNDTCEMPEKEVKLKGLDKDATYVFTNAENSDDTFEMTGTEAMTSLKLKQDAKSAVVWFYNVK